MGKRRAGHEGQFAIETLVQRTLAKSTGIGLQMSVRVAQGGRIATHPNRRKPSGVYDLPRHIAAQVAQRPMAGVPIGPIRPRCVASLYQ